jgi:hypothetical protein
VTDLEDPFSLEALQAAALEKQESEMSADATMSAYEESSLTMEEAPEEPVEESVAAPEYQEPEDEEPIEEAMQPSAAIDAEMEPTVPMKDAGDEGMTGPGPEGEVPADAAETLPVPEIPTAEPVEEPIYRSLNQRLSDSFSKKTMEAIRPPRPMKSIRNWR